RVGLKLAADAAWLAAAFALPLLPFTLFVWRETGNPVFPFYNTLFHSHFWPNFNLYDQRWGPRGLWETLAWPLRITLKPERMGEIAVYSGRVSLAFVVAVVCLFAARRDRRLRLLGFVTLAGAFLWAAMLTGYARYAVFVEVVGGVTLLCSASTLLTASRVRAQQARAVSVGVAALLLCALLAQCLFALSYITRHEWSGRPTVFENYDAYKEESRYVLRDYELEKFLTPAERQPLTNVEVWVESGMLTSGVESLLASDAPILCAYVGDYFVTAEGREKFAGALARGDKRRIASLCLESELRSCRDSIKRRGLEIVDAVPVQIPVYSRRTKLRMVLLTIASPAAPLEQ
ncbi:MAG: hypothetical protein LC754_09265, partial [Acidobacteria bacterium]|nr:hypothetical protein [Acidobacteriota bacterium]